MHLDTRTPHVTAPRRTRGHLRAPRVQPCTVACCRRTVVLLRKLRKFNAKPTPSLTHVSSAGSRHGSRAGWGPERRPWRECVRASGADGARSVGPSSRCHRGLRFHIQTASCMHQNAPAGDARAELPFSSESNERTTCDAPGRNFGAAPWLGMSVPYLQPSIAAGQLTPLKLVWA